jgi:membrane-associated HD superfamily phosphohydrolase
MDWKTVLLALFAIIFIIALALTVWKKNLRPLAKRNEIVLVAIVLTLLLTCSMAVGLGFPGIPWALVAYCVAVFFLQWLINQKFLDKLWKILGLVSKAELKKHGVDASEVLDE